MTGDTSGFVRVIIEFDPASVPIMGWFQREERPREEFRGMLELITLLEAARDVAVRGGAVLAARRPEGR